MRTFRIVGVSLVVLAVGLLLLVLYAGKDPWSLPWFSRAQGGSVNAGPGDVGPVVKLDPFVFTEWSDNRERVNTVTFELEVTDDEGRDALKSRTSEVRAEVLKLLADIQLSTVEDAEGYEALKAQVQARLQPLMPSHPIRRVLITEFLSQ